MDGTACIYWGIFFEWEELPAGTLARDIACKHVTFGFRTPFPAGLLGKKTCVHVVGYGNDGDNEALAVELCGDAEFYGGEEVPHITLSVSEAGRPKDSAYLAFEPIAPYEVEGTFGFFGFDQQVHLG